MSGAAQNKIDYTGRLIIDATRNASSISRSDNLTRVVSLPYDISPEQKYTTIVTFDSDSAYLNPDSIEVVSRRGKMAIVRVTALEMQKLAEMPQVLQVSVGSEVRPMMNTVRETTGVNALQTGAGDLNGSKYTGSGVIAGIMDMGLDVNNINFLDEDGEPRTKILWSLSRSGAASTYDTPQKIKNFSTDSRVESHGTHVLGIMAGSYNGPAEYAFINTRNNLQVKKQNGANSAIPYYGIATDAELAVACGAFTGSNVELGVDKVVNYAKEQGKPSVVNVSIGNTIGPHDGTDARSQWFASLGEESIICIAAGNDGDLPVSISKTFDDEPLRTFVSDGSTGEGQVEFWGNDDRTFTVRFIAKNRNTGEEVYSYTLDKNLEGKTISITGSYYTAPEYIHDPQFDKAFGTMSALILSSNIDSNNNRYSVSASLQLSGSSSVIAPAFEVIASPGQRVDAYANGGLYFSSLGTEGYTDGTPDCSINGLACGENVLVVGSYTNVESWPTLNGTYHYNNFPVKGAISSFSSYGETFDGRLLPDVCAPGGSVIASYSKYYAEGSSFDQKTLTGIYTGEKRNSYWGEMQGTSMACPVAAGIIATWLEADPSLTIDNIKDIIAHTAVHDEFTAIEPDRWGAGKIDALAGLKYILGLTGGVNDITLEQHEAIVTFTGNRTLEIFIHDATNATANLYSLAGTRVATASAAGNTVNLSADNAAPGVYLLKIEGGNKPETRKIAID